MKPIPHLVSQGLESQILEVWELETRSKLEHIAVVAAALMR